MRNIGVMSIMRKYKSFGMFVLGIVIGGILFSGMPTFADIQPIQVLFNDIKVSLDGTLLNMKDSKGTVVQPMVYNGTTYLPVRALCEALNKDVKMNEISNTLEITSKATTTNTLGKEENGLTTTVTKPKHAITFFEENGIQMIELDKLKYVDLDSLKSKLENLGYNIYVGGNYFQVRKLVDNEWKNYSFEVSLITDIDKTLIGKNYVEYFEYENQIKPLIGE